VIPVNVFPLVPVYAIISLSIITYPILLFEPGTARFSKVAKVPIEFSVISLVEVEE